MQLADQHLLWGIPLTFVLLLIFNYITLIKLPNKEERQTYIKRQRKHRLVMTFTRTIIIGLLLIALAFPHDTQERIVQHEPRATIMVDASTSMQLFDTSAAEPLKTQLEQHFPTKLITITPGEESRLGDELLTKAGTGHNIILFSDGHTTSGKDLTDVLLFLATQNTTVNAIKLNPLRGEQGITIEGPSIAIEGAETTYTISLQEAGDINGKLSASVNGDLIIANQPAQHRTFSRTFPTPGDYQLISTLTTDDLFPQNNVYYKTVHVIKKPKLLYVTDHPVPPLYLSLKTIYEVTKRKELPSSLTDYPALIIDNKPSNELNTWTDTLNQYLLNGNGLIVIGGNKAYDKGIYQDSIIETLLPAKVGEATGGGGSDVNVVVVIDISESSGFGFEGEDDTVSRIGVEKGLAIQLIEGFYDQDRVGIVAFNTKGYRINQLEPLTDKEAIANKIHSLNYGLGTNMKAGLAVAHHMLSQVQGSKNIIVISDGVDSDKKNALAAAQAMAEEGITTYAIGVGVDTDRTFMQNLAKIGGGIYFEPDKTQYLSLLFGPPPEGKDEIQQGSNLFVADQDHFITKDLTIRGRVTGINFVTPKSAAQLLITTNQGFPVLTTWRYGLGRVAALATDSGASWSGGIMNEDNQRLWTRLTNWAIGDLSRKVPRFVNAKDTSLGRDLEVLVKNPTPPNDEKLTFVKLEDNWYRATHRPSETGFFQFLDTQAAVTYRTEYLKLGQHPLLEDLVGLTGGDLLDANDPEAIITKIYQQSKVRETTIINYRWVFIGAALIAFFAELIYRRLRESR